MIQFLLLLFISLIFVATSVAEDDFTFLVLADWHGAESYSLTLQSDHEQDITYYAAREIFQNIKATYGGEMVLLPGDTQTGHWYEKEYTKKLETSFNLSNLTSNETIAIASDNCYKTIKKLFTEAGFEKILIAFGDHEIGGNPWRRGTPKVDGLSHFREGLVTNLNKNETGSFLFNASIGDATARPIGTSFASTSFAHAHKSALFITVDAFQSVDEEQYFNREESSGGEGMITCTVTGDHLAWFESVLIAANNDPSIKHIFVQAHVPILQPVRKNDCSGQYMDRAKESEFWRLMQQYGVDVYFAGEVHANTATKDQDSNLLQVVSRANRINNFITVDVTDDSFTISSYNEVGNDWRFNNNYTKYGEIIVDKSANGGTGTSISSSGSLKILEEWSSPLIQFNFEEEDTYPFNSRQIVGIKHNQFKETLLGHNITIRNEISSTGMENHGIFGQQYDAQVANLEYGSANSISGKSYGVFTDSTRAAIYSMGPLLGGEVSACSLFFKTTESKEMILVFYGGSFSTNTKKDIFMLSLKKGNPVVRFNRRRYLTSKNNLGLNDDVWHHIAISMPSKSCLTSEVEMYVNGVLVETVLNGSDEHIFYVTSGKTSLGGWGYSSANFESEYPFISNFVGTMDSFWLWVGTPMTKKMLRLSSKKNFNQYNNFKCNVAPWRKKKGRKTVRSCRRSCILKPDCWGYDVRNKKGKKFKCSHFYGMRPSLSAASNGDRCYIANK